MKNKSSKKIAVISGGTGYLGSAIAHQLVENGFEVVLISKTKGVDITNPKAVEKLAEKVKNKFGTITALIHASSAPLIRQPVLTGSLKDFESQFSVNVLGAFNLFKSFCPLIIPGGAIVGITSQAIEKNDYFPSGSYLPSKFALKGLLKVLSHELKDRSIRVYEIAPAFMPGGLNQDLPEVVKKFIQAKSRPEEITTPEEVAKLITKLINAF